jgi:hypothetical protein
MCAEVASVLGAAHPRSHRRNIVAKPHRSQHNRGLFSQAFGSDRLASSCRVPGLCIKKTMTSLHCSADEFLAECEACHVETAALGLASRFDIPGETPTMVAAAEVASRALAGRRPDQATLDAASAIVRLQKAWARALEPSTNYAVGLLESGQLRCCWAGGPVSPRSRPLGQAASDLAEGEGTVRGAFDDSRHTHDPGEGCDPVMTHAWALHGQPRGRGRGDGDG